MGKSTARKPAFSIRDAREDDLFTLVTFMANLALHVAGSAQKELKDSERERLTQALRDSLHDDNKRLVVADMAEVGPVGMGYVYVWRSQGIWEQTEPVEYRSAVIDDIWVEPEYRSQGIFRAIIQKLVAFAEQRHAHELILEYASSNKEAKAVWTKLGFKTTGVRAAAFTSEVKAILES